MKKAKKPKNNNIDYTVSLAAPYSFTLPTVTKYTGPFIFDPSINSNNIQGVVHGERLEMKGKGDPSLLTIDTYSLENQDYEFATCLLTDSGKCRPPDPAHKLNQYITGLNTFIYANNLYDTSKEYFTSFRLRELRAVGDHAADVTKFVDALDKDSATVFAGDLVGHGGDRTRMVITFYIGGDEQSPIDLEMRCGSPAVWYGRDERPISQLVADFLNPGRDYYVPEPNELESRAHYWHRNTAYTGLRSLVTPEMALAVSNYVWEHSLFKTLQDQMTPKAKERAAKHRSLQGYINAYNKFKELLESDAIRNTTNIALFVLAFQTLLHTLDYGKSVNLVELATLCGLNEDILYFKDKQYLLAKPTVNKMSVFVTKKVIETINYFVSEDITEAQVKAITHCPSEVAESVMQDIQTLVRNTREQQEILRAMTQAKGPNALDTRAQFNQTPDSIQDANGKLLLRISVRKYSQPRKSSVLEKLRNMETSYNFRLRILTPQDSAVEPQQPATTEGETTTEII